MEQDLEKIVKGVIDEHEDAVTDYHNDIEGARSFLVGKVLEETDGQANVSRTAEMIDEVLS